MVALMVGVVGYAQERPMPIEVREFLDNYIKDSTADYGPIDAKNFGYLPRDLVQIRDLKLRIVELYQFKHVYLNSYPDTVALSELIEPSGRWSVLVMAQNKPFYQVFLDNYQCEKTERAGMSDIGEDNMTANKWKALLEAYPGESTEIKAVFFSRLGVTLNATECFLYFREKGPRKIFYIKPGRPNDELEKLFTGSIDNLDDSQKLMRYWKEQGINEVGIRDESGATGVLEPKRSSKR